VDVKDVYDICDQPPLGTVPRLMHAYAVRQNRFGQPRDAWKREIVPTPTLEPDEVLIYVMAGEPEDFHAGGSDCSGVVWAT
jgi:crotonyl-CoA carboxylase/reductase